MTALRSTATATFAALALGAAACGGGGSSDSDEVKKVASHLANAAPAVCGEVPDTFLKQQLGGTKAACEKAAKASKGPKAKAGSVKVDGKKATAALSQGKSKATVKLVKQGDDWKINGAGQ